MNFEIHKEVLDWCEKNAKELNKFAIPDTRKYAGIIIIDTDLEQATLFALMAVCSEGPSLWCKKYRSEKDVWVQYNQGGFKFSGLDVRDINKTKEIRIFAIDDQGFNAVLNKRSSKAVNSGYADEYMGIIDSEFDAKKGEIPTYAYNFATAEPVETIAVDSMDDNAIAAKFSNMMLKGKAQDEMVVGVDGSSVVFVLSHWGGAIQSGRYFEKGARMAKAFKTLKIFKEFFNKSNLKSLGVTEIRVYESNK